jgi:hypothetical protein
MIARWLVIPLLAMFAFSVEGCGERPQVTVYKQGQYKGKPDNLPWQSAPFNGSRGDWEKSIDGRTKNQNEYLRIQ